MMTDEKTKQVTSSWGQAIRRAYRAGQEDEALEPLIMADRAGRPLGRPSAGDSLIFYDIRGEREIEITEALTDPEFSIFPVNKDLNLNFVTMIEYDPGLPVRAAFPKQEKLKNTLAEVLSAAGLHLAKIAESEKAAHVGFFMNGKSDEVFPGEVRIIIPSPEDVARHDERPEMSVGMVAAEIVKKIGDENVPVIIANFANVDVIGHIENKASALAAVEAVDRELGKVVTGARSQKATLLLTSDHGTVEEWLYPDGTINTGHTKNPVPFILADFSFERPDLAEIKKEGELADVAPTVLELAGLEKPAEMTGEGLLMGTALVKNPRKKIVLLILDGWGLRDALYGNLIAEAQTPNFDELWTRFPHAVLKSSGEAVGMPPNTVGNSEAGHLHLGAGRRVLLDRVRIDRAVGDGSFYSNGAFLWAMESAKRKRKPLHLMGIISHYSSHGTIKHLFALLQMAKDQGLKDVFIHGFIGRRGEKPESGAIYVEKVEEKCRELGLGQVVTIIGRHWALDREKNWDRVEKTYRALIFGEGTPVTGPKRNFVDEIT